MVVLMMEMVGRLKIRWEVTNPGVDKVLDRVVGWAEVNADLRISLLGWLSSRTDDQILEDAMEMVDALESTAYTDTVTRMGEMIMIDVVEICTILLRNDVLRRDGRQEEDSGMGGAIESLEYHECDEIKLDLTETIATEE